MMEEDSERLCGPRHRRSDQRAGHRWGWTTGRLGFHGGTIEVERSRVRRRDGGEMSLPSWEAARAEDARQMGDGPDAVERLDPPVRPRGPPAGGRRSRKIARQPVQVGRLAPVRRVVGRTYGRMDVVGSVTARSARYPDR